MKRIYVLAFGIRQYDLFKNMFLRAPNLELSKLVHGEHIKYVTNDEQLRGLNSTNSIIVLLEDWRHRRDLNAFAEEGIDNALNVYRRRGGLIVHQELRSDDTMKEGFKQIIDCIKNGTTQPA